jgi:hypothetical protein
MEIDNKLNDNIKKLLCYNIVNNSKCVYKGKCMFAHNLQEQKKEPIREFIHNMIYMWDDLSNIDIHDDKELFEELSIYTKECKNCIIKKCPGGYNCKFGVCIKDIKICYGDLMYGKCYNLLKEETVNNKSIKRCIHGVHLTEKFMIPYYQRVPLDIYPENIDLYKNNIINYNYKNNTISLLLNDNTIGLVKDLISNKLNKIELIKNFNNLKNNINKNENNIFNNDEINEIENEINEIENEINEIENEIKNEIENEIKNEIESEIKNEIESELENKKYEYEQYNKDDILEKLDKLTDTNDSILTKIELFDNKTKSIENIDL